MKPLKLSGADTGRVAACYAQFGRLILAVEKIQRYCRPLVFGLLPICKEVAILISTNVIQPVKRATYFILF